MKGKLIKSSLIVLLAGFLLVGYYYSYMIRLVFIDSFGFIEIADEIYTQKKFSEKDQKKAINLISEARQRVTDYYGEPLANPKILFVSDDEEATKLNLPKGIPGVAYLTPWESYIILDANKIGIDVVAHELVHAEILARLGYLKRTMEIPTWFDEGAALQVDFRHHYIDLPTITSAEFFRVTALDKPSKFWSDDAQQNIRNYQGAKAAYAKLLGQNSSVGLYYILDKVKQGEDLLSLIDRLRQE
ncbi:hypothetical protein [Ostreibacterium oceani]|uniref:Peptidase MA-like domain-containing protein n=1 Tax=Ostreibacterium oceani TaxID=2654998 RepID=A0A6N7EVW0_9GAMM|nr:hypothetical protein [Ostreibacterium oceani]MPV85690.1 hypothetical protein [Ostreibacterium oceani]